MTEQDDFLKWPDRGVDHDDVIELFCKLQSRVRNTHPLKYPGASDCFCGRGKGFWGVDEYDGTHEGGYRNDGVVFERIVACCEAMQGIDDPAKFVEAVRELLNTLGDFVVPEIWEDWIGEDDYEMLVRMTNLASAARHLKRIGGGE